MLSAVISARTPAPALQSAITSASRPTFQPTPADSHAAAGPLATAITTASSATATLTFRKKRHHPGCGW